MTTHCPKCTSNISLEARRCRYCQSDIGPRSMWDMINTIVKHPLTLLAIATLISLPQITKAMARNQAAEEARIRKGLDAVAAAFQVERDLNASTTLFYSFDRDFARQRLPPEKYASAQNDLRQTLMQMWTTFDRDAWWWSDQVRLETSLLRGLDAHQLKTFQALTDAYKDNLIRTTRQVDRLWTHFIRKRQSSTEEAEALRKETYACFNALGDRRHELATRIAGFFEHSLSADLASLKLDEKACPQDELSPKSSPSN